MSAVATVDVQEATYGHIAIAEGRGVETVEPESTEAIVRAYFKDIPIMIEVARCESTFRHELSDGSILQGRVDPDDTGVMQINKRYNEKSAISMNLDVENIYDNMAYARNIYDKQGEQPWSASAPCWNNTFAANF